MASVFDVVLHVLLPRACLACGRDLPLGREDPLCAREVLPRPPEPACVRCGGTLGAGRALCRSCSGRLFSCRLVRAACAHRGAAASLVHAFKFRGYPGAARFAGRIMARELERRPELSGFDALAPAPLHPRRARERGYNQALLLAEGISRESGLPILEVLERMRGAKASWRAGKEKRKRELTGAFSVQEEKAKLAAGRRILIVDDVCASGTTLEDCARALREAGAADVAGWVFTRAAG